MFGYTIVMLGRWNSVEVGGFLVRIQSAPSCGSTDGVEIQIACGNTDEDYDHPPNPNIPPRCYIHLRWHFQLLVIISY